MDSFLRSSLIGGAAVANAKRPRIRSRVLTIPSFFSAWITTEAAGLFLTRHVVRSVRAVGRGAHRTPQGRAALALEVATMAGLASLIQQSRHTGDEFEAVLAPVLDPANLAARPPAVRMGAVIPVLAGVRKVEMRRNVAYHDGAGWRNKLDIYEAKGLGSVTSPEAVRGLKRPALVEIHGGGWILGDKNQQGVPLLNHMASNGWVGFNINYRLAPRSKFPEQLIDCKRAIAWIRTNAEELGIDPDFICVTGGSAGGYLTAMMALTANDPEFQPGFEEVDTTVQAAVPFYGVYDLFDEGEAFATGFHDFLERVVVGSKRRIDADRWRRYSPLHRVHADAPPMLVIHGTSDTLVPVEQARPFAQRLAATSDHTALYAELAGANHAFDIFPSPRSVRTTEYVERFLTGVRSGIVS